MNLIRKLLSHGFLIFTLVVLAAAYYYREQLFPGLMHSEKGEQEAAGSKPGEMVVEPYSKIAPPGTQSQAGVSDQPPQFRPEEPTAAETGKPAPTGTFSSAAPPADSGAPQFREEETVTGEGDPEWDRPLPKASGTPPTPLPSIPEALSEQQAALAPPVPAPAPAPGQAVPPEGQQPVSSAAPPGEPPMMAPPGQVPGQTMMPPAMPGQPPMPPTAEMPPLAGAVPPGAAVPPSPGTMPMGMSGSDAYGPVYGAVRRPPGVGDQADPDQLSLNAARQAYWKGDLESAKREYDDLIARIPDNPDIYGELGNLHYAQGDWNGAAGAYYEAGTRLVKQGRLAQAMHLLTVIRGLSKEKADAFEAFLKEQGRGDLLR